MLVNSTLPMESLGKIWDLSDMDHDGALDRHEFTVVSDDTHVYSYRKYI